MYILFNVSQSKSGLRSTKYSNITNFYSKMKKYLIIVCHSNVHQKAMPMRLLIT